MENKCFKCKRKNCEIKCGKYSKNIDGLVYFVSLQNVVNESIKIKISGGINVI